MEDISAFIKKFPQPRFVWVARFYNSVKSHLPSKVVFHVKPSSIKGWHLPSKVVLNQSVSSIEDCLPFHKRISSYQISSSRPLKVPFNLRLSSILDGKLSTGSTRFALDCFITSCYSLNPKLTVTDRSELPLI